ncbi:MAG: hypothetical protein ABFS10_11960 [Bacteroidota bacterium]
MLTGKRKYSLPVILTLAMVILSVLFHHPIEIIDAITSLPVPGYGIEISTWRLLFEPWTGPLLFYLRADQPLAEFAVLLLWILTISLLWSIARPGSQPVKTDRGRRMLNGLLTWLRVTPLIVGTWLGLLWLIIYIPLPSNTIENGQENTVLINTHSHTEQSHDGIISTKRLHQWHRRNGYDAFFITDHNHHRMTLETVRAQEEGAIPPEPLIMAGEEFSGSNHMTLLGLTRDFSTRGLTDRQVIDTTHAAGGVVIVAHWFDDENETIPHYTEMGVDGFEIANQASGLTYDRRVFEDIVHTCTTQGLLMAGVADYHGYGSTCFAWNALEIPGWHQMETSEKRESIMELLRQRDMSRVGVLLYNDRNTFDRNRVFLSPLYNIINYFRTLNGWQLLSWFIWLVLIGVGGKRFKNSLWQIVHLRPGESLAIISSLFLLVNGILILSRVDRLKETNDIYGEYSTLLLLCGAGFLLYTITMVLVRRRRSNRQTNQ